MVKVLGTNETYAAFIKYGGDTVANVKTSKVNVRIMEDFIVATNPLELLDTSYKISAKYLEMRFEKLIGVD